MERMTVTPFGRQAVTAGLLASQAMCAQPSAQQKHGKWELFRAVCTARAAFGVSDRDLTVLNALLSFHKDADLRDDEVLVVHPSNRTLAERAHGMAESTLRRHVAALVRAGLIVRHDSPNGKRFARRDRNGDTVVAYGFDLRPLLVRAQEIFAAADAARAAEEDKKRARERCVLLVRDAVKLLQYGQETAAEGLWDAWEDALRLAQRSLRRKLVLEELEALAGEVSEIRERLVAVFEPVQQRDVGSSDTENLSGNDVDIERHHQNSNTDYLEIEHCQEKGRKNADVGASPLPVSLVVKACSDILDYAAEPIEAWPDFVRTAAFVRGILGISQSAWNDAVQNMGACDAAIAVACILQRADHIRSPGGYLRRLSQKAADGAFSTGPMVMALLNGRARQAA